MSYSNHTMPWTESPFFYNELMESKLSDKDKELVRHFAEKGYVIVDPEVGEETIDKLVSTLMPAFDKERSTRIQDAWKTNEYVKEIASSDVIMEKLRLLYKREPMPFQTLNFSVGTEQKTHSDMIHFNSIPQRFMCGVWVALEDITNDNGPLHYFPGSQKLPFYDMIDLGVKASETIEMKKMMMAYAENYEVFIGEMVKALGLQKSVLNIKKGQALIWSANLLHGAEKINTQGASRHSQVTHYYFSDCVYYVPRLSDIAINRMFIGELYNIKTGERLKSNYLGQQVTPPTKIYLQQKTVKLLSKISHLFPKQVVEKVKSIIVK
jgi:hypothetical protein